MCIMSNEVIRFYSVGDDYGAFSNFAPYPIVVAGKTWPTSEHYFQAAKFEDRKDQEEIRKTKSPMIAARKGGTGSASSDVIGSQPR
jgi:N-glycosidase YbiA